MAVTEFTLTGDLSELVDQPIKGGTIEIGVYGGPPQIAFPAGNQIRVVGGKWTIPTTGLISKSLPHTNITGANPATFQYEIRIVAFLVGGRKVKLDPIYVTANTGTTTVDLADALDTNAASPTWLTGATAALQAVIDAGEATLEDLVDEGTALRDETRDLRDETIDISGISTPDSVVEALVKNTGGAGPLTSAALAATFVATVSPLAIVHGGEGDGTTDDTAAVQSAIDEAALARWGTVDLRGYEFKITAPLEIPEGVRLQGGVIHQATAGQRLADVNGDYVTFRDVELRGPQSATYTIAERLISAVGTVGAKVTGLTVKGCTLADSGGYGIVGEHLDAPTIEDNTIEDIHYAAAAFFSTPNGRFTNNRVRNVLGTGSPGNNAYGVSLSRDELNNLTDAPKCTDWVIQGNQFRDIATWCGVDFHGAERVAVNANLFRNVKNPVGVGETDNASNVTTWASHDIVVSNNDMDSTKTDGSWPYAISITGCVGSGIGTPGELATGVRIVGNKIRGYGVESSTIGSAIFFRDTKGLVVANNTIIEPGYAGILAYYDNYGYVISGNIIVDPWSNTVGIAEGVGVVGNRSDYNTGVISGNATVRGTKSATYVATYCVASYGTTGADVRPFGNMGGSTATVRGSSGYGAVDFGAVPLTTTGLATLGSAYVGGSAQGALTSVSSGSTVEGYQIAARGRVGGYGAGIRFESTYSTGGAVGAQALITADGTGSWADAANASSRLTFKVANAGSLIESFRIHSTGDIHMADGRNFKAATGTGTKIGLASTEKWAFWGATPIVRPASTPAAATDAATTQTLVNDLRTKLLALGLIS